MSTSQEILDRLQAYLGQPRPRHRRLPRVECADGFSMSVQVGEGLYCTPRNDTGPWSAVEIGFPSRIEPLLWEYAEEPAKWTDTVYPYVPLELAAAVVEVHGGFLTVQSIEESE